MEAAGMESERYDEVVQEAQVLVKRVMDQWDSSHDAFHALRVRDLALSLASEQLLPPAAKQILRPQLNMVHRKRPLSLVNSLIVFELLQKRHHIPRDNKEHETAEQFLVRNNVPASMIQSITLIIHNMGFKEELSGHFNSQHTLEFGIVQDADRLDAMGAIGIARCFTYGGSRNRLIHDPNVPFRFNMTKDDYMKQEGKNTGINHFHEKLLKLKDLMKTEAGRRRAEGRHTYLENFLTEFYGEWEGKL